MIDYTKLILASSAAGMTPQEISKKFEIPMATVQQVLVGAGKAQPEEDTPPPPDPAPKPRKRRTQTEPEYGGELPEIDPDDQWSADEPDRQPRSVVGRLAQHYKKRAVSRVSRIPRGLGQSALSEIDHHLGKPGKLLTDKIRKRMGWDESGDETGGRRVTAETVGALGSLAERMETALARIEDSLTDVSKTVRDKITEFSSVVREEDRQSNEDMIESAARRESGTNTDTGASSNLGKGAAVAVGAAGAVLGNGLLAQVEAMQRESEKEQSGLNDGATIGNDEEGNGLVPSDPESVPKKPEHEIRFKADKITFDSDNLVFNRSGSASTSPAGVGTGPGTGSFDDARGYSVAQSSPGSKGSDGEMSTSSDGSMRGGKPGPGRQYTKNEISEGFMTAVKSKVTNPFGLAAVAATGQSESGYEPGKANGSWADPSASGRSGTSGGIMSWRNERLRALYAFAAKNGESPGSISPKTQADFFLQENPGLIDKLNSAKSVEEAQRLMNNAWAFKGYDQPGGEAQRRIDTARGLLPEFQKTEQAEGPDDKKDAGPKEDRPTKDDAVKKPSDEPAPEKPKDQDPNKARAGVNDAGVDGFDSGRFADSKTETPTFDSGRFGDPATPKVDPGKFDAGRFGDPSPEKVEPAPFDPGRFGDPTPMGSQLNDMSMQKKLEDMRPPEVVTTPKTGRQSPQRIPDPESRRDESSVPSTTLDDHFQQGFPGLGVTNRHPGLGM